MPGPQVKNWKVYHALVEEGHSKESAARIANAQAHERVRSKRSKKRKRKAVRKSTRGET